MPANTTPIFSKAPSVEWKAAGITAGNTTKTLTSGTISLIFTADATNGGRVDKLMIMPLSTNVATVLRIWINNGSATTTEENNVLIGDITMVATTNSEVAALGVTQYPLDLPLPAGYRIYVTLGTTVAGGFSVTAIAGKY